MTLPVVRYPDGLYKGARIVANKRHAAVNPRVKQKRRQGTVVAPTANPIYVRILWDGCRSHQAVDRRFFDPLNVAERR